MSYLRSDMRKQKAVFIKEGGEYLISTLLCYQIDYGPDGVFLQYPRAVLFKNDDKYILDRYDFKRDTVYYKFLENIG